MQAAVRWGRDMQKDRRTETCGQPAGSAAGATGLEARVAVSGKDRPFLTQDWGEGTEMPPAG